MDRLRAIDQRVADGSLPEDLAAAYRVAAFTRPDLLPPEIAAQPNPPVSCATPAFVQAFQLSSRGLMGRAAAELYQAGNSRPTSVGYYDSTKYPVRVHYTTTALATRAETVLGFVELSWQKQTETMGFRPPLGDFGGIDEGGSPALDVYIGTTDPGASGYTAPEYEWTDTPWTDCTTFIVISQYVTGGELQTTMAHELNHAMQAASDCSEWSAFWENTSTYVMDLTYDDVDDYVSVLPDFQRVPSMPFEHFVYMSGYQYGGMIVAATADEALGAGDGTALAKIWRGCEQTSAGQNTTSYFDAIAAQVGAANGGIDEFQSLLAEWRYLAGSRNDNHHLRDAGLWSSLCSPHNSCEPPDDTTFSLVSLPVGGSAAGKPHPHGSSYIRVNLEGDVSGVFYVTFSGDTDTRWGASVICWGNGPAAVTPLAIDANGRAAANVTVTSQRNCTLAVSNLGPATYNPSDTNDYDTAEATSHTFAYGFDFTDGTLTPPVINSITPAQIPCTSTSTTTVVVRGSGFWQDLTATADGDPVTVTALNGNSLTITLPARMTSGHMHLTITNRDGQSTTTRITYLGDGCTCDCDHHTSCEEGCDCDPECLACTCDTTDACDPGCDCDQNCPSGCGCNPTERPEPIAAFITLALFAGGLRSRRRLGGADH